MSKLKQIRLQNKMTQKDVANSLNIPKTTYIGYEHGRRKLPVPIAIELGKIYNLNWTIFFDDYVLNTRTYQNT